jgi:hypothetical protein
MILSAVIVNISRLLLFGFTFFERDFRLLYQKGDIIWYWWGRWQLLLARSSPRGFWKSIPCRDENYLSR